MYGEHGFNAILGSINTKTFLPGCDLVTARYASELVGQTTVWGRAFDDAPGTQYDKTRTTEAARPLIDPSEIRQLPMHKQAITIIETMPPVKWTFPKSVKGNERCMPRKYGEPHIINLTQAELRRTKHTLNENKTQRQLPPMTDETTTTLTLTLPGNQKEELHAQPQSESNDFIEKVVRKESKKSVGHLFDMVVDNSTLQISS